MTVILVAGSANLDFVVQAAHIPAPGETVMGSSFHQYPGGKGANQAVACARAGGVATQFLGAFGADALAIPVQDSLRDAGVVVSTITIASQPTGTAFICVSEQGENAITVVPGANAALAPAHLPALDGISHLLMQLETPLATVDAFAATAKAAGVTVVLNAAPANPACVTLLDKVDVLVVNEGELAQLSGGNGSICAQMDALPVPTVVTTLGHRGCIAKTPHGHSLQTSFPVTAVDTTAAGDTFCGALVAALSERASFSSAMQQASAAAALACTRAGAQTSIPTKAEVTALLSNALPASGQGLDALRAYCGLAT